MKIKNIFFAIIIVALGFFVGSTHSVDATSDETVEIEVIEIAEDLSSTTDELADQLIRDYYTDEDNVNLEKQAKATAYNLTYENKVIVKDQVDEKSDKTPEEEMLASILGTYIWKDRTLFFGFGALMIGLLMAFVFSGVAGFESGPFRYLSMFDELLVFIGVISILIHIGLLIFT